MKETTAQAKPDRAARPAAGPNAAALAPPAYGIDFLDRRPQAAPSADQAPAEPWLPPIRFDNMPFAPAARPERLLAHELRHTVQQRSAAEPAETRPAPDGQAPKPGGANAPADAASAKPPQAWTATPPAVQAEGRGAAGFLAVPKAKQESAGAAKDATAAAPAGRGAANFLAAAGQARLETAGAAKAPPAKSRLPQAAAPTQDTAPKKAEAKAAPPLPAKAAAPAEAGHAAPSPAAEQAAPAHAETAPGGGAAPAQGVEDLAGDKPATPEEAKTQDKLDAAEPAAADGGGAAETAGPEEAAPAEAGAEPAPEAEPKAEEPPGPGGGAGGMAAAPPPADEGAAQAQASQQAAQVDRMEQADREHAAEQRAEEREQERAEEQPAAAQVQAAPEGGAESAELSPQEKAAGLAAVGEDAGGGEAATGGGGGGAAGAAPEPAPEAPDTSAMEPEAGLSAAAGLPVGAAAKALGGVGGAVEASVQQEGGRLQDAMPEVEIGGEGGGSAAKPPAAGGGAGKTPRSPAKSAQPAPAPKPLAEPPPSPVKNAPAPRLAPAADGALTAADARRVQASIQNLPTTDPGLDLPAGPPPKLSLSGEADPSQIADQKAALQASVAAEKARGAADVAAPAGEDDIRVRRPREALKAKALAVPSGGGAGGVEDTEETLALVAEAKKGGEVRAAIRQARGEAAAKKAEHQTKVAEEKDKARQQLDELQAENAGQQDEARRQAKAEVAKARADWTSEQQKEAAKADEKTQAELAKGEEKISREQQQADERAAAHIEEGERQAARHKRDAESQAESKKKDAEGESQGVFGWLADQASAFFDKLKQGLSAIFEAAKRLVRAAIEKAKQLAVAVIEKARAAVVAIIRAAGEALIAIGDALLAAFPALRAKWRAFIESKVKAAEELVNKLADALKKGVQKLLDLLGKGLEFLLAAYQKAMLAALDAARAAAMGAIKFAKSVADTLGAFAAIVKDIARNPGQWLSNLGAAVKDGIKNHLWKAFSGAVKGWFNDKIDEVAGIGSAVWGVLKKGGLAFKEVAGMAWQGLKQAIPSALIGLLIEKLVAMIVPAAGAVMVVVEGLKAAWGSVQRIVAAAAKFVEFLKAVKNGGAGPQFASMLAAAAVAVIDFVANWLLRKLRGPASKVGGKIKAIARKIMDKIKSLAKRAGRWLKGKFRKLRDKFKGWKKKFGDWRQKRKDKQQEKQERLQKAVEAIRPKVAKLVARGASKFHLLAQFAFWRVRYRLSSLSLKRSGDNYIILAKVNPESEVVGGIAFDKNKLVKFILEVSREVLADAKKEDAKLAESTDREGRPLTTVPPQATVAKNVAEEREKVPLPEKRVKRTRYEAGAEGHATEISQKQGKGEDIRNQIVSGTSGPGTSAQPAQPYLEQKEDPAKGIKAKEGLAADLNREPGAAEAIESFVRPGRIAKTMDPHKTAEVVGVLQQEAVRSDLAVAEIAAMVGTAKALGKAADWKQLMASFPMQRKSARVIHESLERQLDADVAKAPRGKRVKLLRDDIVRQIKAWIEAMQLVFDNEGNAQKTLREMIRNFWAVKKKTEG